jgi:hypothetical protein
VRTATPRTTKLTASRLRRLLEALELGALSSADAIRKALRGERHLAAWIDASEARWKGSAVRRPAVRGQRPVPAALVEAAVRAARKRHGRKKGVVSIHWGLVRCEGRSTEEQGVIVTVERKKGKKDLRPKQRIRRWLPVRQGGRASRVRVDVHAVSAQGTPQMGVRPGNHASVEVGGLQGALGAVLEDGGGLRAVVSGHVARRKGLTATARTSGGDEVPLGVVERVMIGMPADVASSGPLEAADAARIALEPVDLYDLDSGDLNTAIWIQTARDLAPRKAFITDIGASAPFDYDTGSQTVQGLIATSHAVTEPGDSGAPAVDIHGRLVGFVVGIYDGRTYLVPARRALENLES